MALSDLVEKGWVMVEPPEEEDELSVVGRRKGEPIRAGFMLDTIEDNDELLHTRYRSGRYNLELKVDFEIGRGFVKVEEAEGYDE